MTWIQEKEVTSITSDDDRDLLLVILNAYFAHTAQRETDFTQAVANNMLIGAAYNILENSEYRDELLMRNMQMIREEILRNKLGRETFPDAALIETAYSIYIVWRNTNYFGKFVNSFNEYLADVTGTYIRYFYENKQKLGYGFYSLWSGLSGICSYFLEFGEDYRNLIEELLDILVYITDEESKGSARIVKQIDLVNNSLDFSLSNGIGGILMVMTKAYNHNLVVPGQERAMNQIIGTYRRHAMSRDHSVYWPGLLHLEQRPHLSESVNIKETWAYGALAIARILHAAGKAVHLADTVEWAHQILLSKGRLPVPEFMVMNPSLTSGYAGVLSLFDAIGREVPSIVFDKAKNNLLYKIIEFYTDEPEPGFQLKEIRLVSGKITETSTLDNHTISNGSAGIMLSIVSAFSTAEPWLYRYMGIS